MNSLQTCIPGIYSEATDGELFERMMQRDDAAKEAWAEFHRRYFKDFRRFVCRIRGLSPAGVDDLVQETMIQAYKAAHTFKPGDATDEALRVRTLAWLGIIARNIYNSTWRTKKDVTVNDFAEQDVEGNVILSERERRLNLGKISREIREAEDKVAGFNRNDKSRASNQKQLLHNALETLTERERDILLATHDHYQRGQVQQRMPQQVIDEICERYNINSTHLRKLRGRADNKIKQYVKAYQLTESQKP